MKSKDEMLDDIRKRLGLAESAEGYIMLMKVVLSKAGVGSDGAMRTFRALSKAIIRNHVEEAHKKICGGEKDES